MKGRESAARAPSNGSADLLQLQLKPGYISRVESVLEDSALLSFVLPFVHLPFAFIARPAVFDSAFARFTMVISALTPSLIVCGSFLFFAFRRPLVKVTLPTYYDFDVLPGVSGALRYCSLVSPALLLFNHSANNDFFFCTALYTVPPAISLTLLEAWCLGRIARMSKACDGEIVAGWKTSELTKGKDEKRLPIIIEVEEELEDPGKISAEVSSVLYFQVLG